MTFVAMTTGRFRTHDVWEGVKPVTLMLLVQALYAGVALFYKLAAVDEMNIRVLIAYRCIFAAVSTCPLAFFLERKRWPKLTWRVLCQAFFCGLLGGPVSQNLYAQSIAITSATFAAAMANLIPVFTYIVALLVRFEKLQIKRPEGLAKILGTIIEVGGAMVLTLYKGKQVDLWWTHISILHHAHGDPIHAKSSRWIAASAMSMGSALSYAIYLNVQTKMAKRYPCHFSSTALSSAMGAVQATVLALCTNRDWSQWKLGWNTKLLVVSYTGIVGYGICVALVAWCINLRGPVFGTAFSPMTLVFVAMAGSLFLNEDLHVGSLVGGAVIVVGLYLVLWGKSKEMRRLNKDQKMTIPLKSRESAEPMVDHNCADRNVDGIPESHPVKVMA